MTVDDSQLDEFTDPDLPPDEDEDDAEDDAEVAASTAWFGANDVHEYGQAGDPAWVTPVGWDGEMAIAIRRPELLEVTVLAGWWNDLKAWSTWMIHAFRLTNKFPPCWPQHPALVEELMALWLLWQSGWLPAEDPTKPAAFLQQLDFSISRCERVWKIPCDSETHKPQPTQGVGTEGEPELHRWWGNDNYNRKEQ